MSRIQNLSRRRQHGAALVFVLILLLVMTWMGVASMRGTALGERMSASIYDRSIAFQAAEAALREAEVLVRTNPTFPANNAGCAAGLCGYQEFTTAADLPRWKDPATPWRESAVTLAVDSDGDGTSIVTNPEFVVEAMGVASNWADCAKEIPRNDQCMSPRYRVTARSSEANRAQVILQSSISAF